MQIYKNPYIYCEIYKLLSKNCAKNKIALNATNYTFLKSEFKSAKTFSKFLKPKCVFKKCANSP